jgi:hypothetical protein
MQTLQLVTKEEEEDKGLSRLKPLPSNILATIFPFSL